MAVPKRMTRYLPPPSVLFRPHLPMVGEPPPVPINLDRLFGSPPCSSR